MNNLGDIMRQVVCIPSHIPDDWSFLKLIEVCSPKQWRTISSSEMKKTGYPVFGANGFVGFYHEYNHEDEAVAITCRGNTCGTINRIPPKTYITGNSMALDDIRSTVVTKNYLYYALKYRGVGDSISGSAQPQITGAGLRSIEFPAPSLPEQQRIAAILSSVDDVIEKTRAQVDKLKDLKTGMMQELLTKGIGHTEFKDSPVGRIPASWKTQSLKSLSRRITDGTHQSVKTSDSGEIPFLYVSCIRNGEILWDKASGLTESDYKVASKGRVASPGDILYTAVGSYGHAALVETDQRFSFQRHIAFIQPDKSIIDPRYLVSVLNSTLGRTQADRFAIGNAQLTVTLGDLGTFMIPTPPIQEQNKIAKATSAIISNIHEHETKLDSLIDLKKALMQDLLTGKVRVKTEEKEKEPAVA